MSGKTARIIIIALLSIVFTTVVVYGIIKYREEISDFIDGVREKAKNLRRAKLHPDEYAEYADLDYELI